MKKIFCLFLFCSLTLSGFALSVGDLFVLNSRFWQNKLSLHFLDQSMLSAALNFSLTDHKHIDNKIYSFHLPVLVKLTMVDFTVEPFFYPDASNDAYAYGGKIKAEGLLRNDSINNTYAGGYISAAYANQRANITRQGMPQNKENFKQFAFEGGLNFNFAQLYNFNINGNIFTYPDKAGNIVTFGGIMNQNDLADLGTIDYVLNLPHFSLGGGITWFSPENNTKTSLNYKYINYEQDLTAHSVMLQTKIPVSEKLIATLIYNHLFEKHHTNRDLFGIGLNYLF